MGSTELRKNGVNLKRLSDKMVRFCFAYMIHMNATQAAIDAGYGVKGASVMGARLLKNPKVKALIGNLRKKDCEKFTIERHKILQHLASGALRDGRDFVDDKGVIHTNLRDLPEDITRAIDGIKQKVRTRTTRDGEEIVEVETELKLMSKAACLDLAMRHKGLFATQEVDLKVKFDFNELFEDQSETIDVDITQQYLEGS